MQTSVHRRLADLRLPVSGNRSSSGRRLRRIRETRTPWARASFDWIGRWASTASGLNRAKIVILYSVALIGRINTLVTSEWAQGPRRIHADWGLFIGWWHPPVRRHGAGLLAVVPDSGPEHTLQTEAGYIDARPRTDRSTKTSCDARPAAMAGLLNRHLGVRHVTDFGRLDGVPWLC
jgi:hypothetical protein